MARKKGPVELPAVDPGAAEAGFCDGASLEQGLCGRQRIYTEFENTQTREFAKHMASDDRNE
jgi:hypothetical protein